LMGSTPRHFVAPLCIFSLVRLRLFSRIKIFSSASCFHPLLVLYYKFHRFTVHFDSLSFFTPTHALSHTTMY
jgi:hypothetical protein